MPAAPLAVRRRYLIMMPRLMPAASRRRLIVVAWPSPKKPFLKRRRYLIVVPEPLPAVIHDVHYVTDVLDP